jgi:hypothetical protein
MATYWTAHLEPRQQTHVAFARAYARDFNHGAPGHLDLVLVARLAELLDAANQTLQEIRRPSIRVGLGGFDVLGLLCAFWSILQRGSYA